MKYDVATTLYLAAMDTRLPLLIRRSIERIAVWLDGPVVVDDDLTAIA